MNICIVGGGTAGWIAAFYISKAQPGVHNITVIESSKIGIIGAGEGSVGSFAALINGGFFDYKIDENKFVKETDAIPKMGLKHVKWTSKMDSYFAPIDVSPTATSTNDYIFKYIYSKHGKSKMHLASRVGIDYENKVYRRYAFHFDGHKVGLFFKNECKNDKIKLYDSVVNDVILDVNGNIKELIIDDGQKITADLFIDCTGFSRVLIRKIASEWVSKKHVLPLNTAMPFIVNYKENEVDIPATTATALSSGWMWNIPLQSRKGCGYVFDSNFISIEKAKEEVEKTLGHEITPIKIINFDSGYSKYFWKNNVLALGLASSFFEPLEATSIHNTIIQIVMFVDNFLNANYDEKEFAINQKLYNNKMTSLNEVATDFISLHYQGGRDDSEFWRYIKNDNIVTPTAKSLVDQSKIQIPGTKTTMEESFGSHQPALANWILAGMDLITPERALYELKRDSRLETAKMEYSKFYEYVSSGKTGRFFAKGPETAG